MKRKEGLIRRIVPLVVITALFLGGCHLPYKQTDGSTFRTVAIGDFTQERLFNNNKTRNIYDDFYNNGQAEMIIPGLNQKIVPQGMDDMPEDGYLVVSGYGSESEGSKLFLVELKENGRLVKVLSLADEQGQVFTGHAGGVAITPDEIYISGDKCLYAISRQAILDADALDIVCFEKTIPLMTNASFCNYSEGVLWAGDFYMPEEYETEEFRHITNRDGVTYCAWSAGYTLETLANGVMAGDDVIVPDYIYSIRDKIQGFTILEDQSVVLSQSYGRKNDSHIYLYSNPMNDEPNEYYAHNGCMIPLWYLDSELLLKDITAPPMSEGIFAYKNRVYVLFESGAHKYSGNIFYKNARNPLDSIWRLEVK